MQVGRTRHEDRPGRTAFFFISHFCQNVPVSIQPQTTYKRRRSSTHREHVPLSNRTDLEILRDESNDQLDISVWYRRVYALCQAKLISQSDAEDAAQETFVRGIARLHELRSMDAMGGWLRGIARNVCIDVIRRNKVRQSSPEPVETLAARTDSSPDRSDQLIAYVKQLPDPLREVVLLHYYEEMTYDQMARWLGVARSTVSERLGRARKILKQKMIADRSMP